jgi:alcohol dehydrogenase class IV
MLKSFRFSGLPQVAFGKGKIMELPSILKKFGNPVMLVTGKSSFAASQPAGILFREMETAGIEYHLVTVTSEPTAEMVDQTVERFRGVDFSAVISIGGGSVMDAGKAISAMLDKKESVSEYIEGVGNKEHPGTKKPFIAVPTTAGTGSEATKNAVLSGSGGNKFKKSIRHDNFVPDMAIIDPTLALGCSPDITASCGMDCFVQLTEAYLSVSAHRVTDGLALEGVKAVKESLRKCVADGWDLEARTGMSYAALLSGICLANAGLGVIHGFASSLGGMFDIPHGIICGSTMAAANEINVRELRRTSDHPESLAKYCTLGRIFLETEGKSEDYYIDGFISILYELTLDLRIPRLARYGISGNDLVQLCNETSLKNNPIKLSHENLVEILTRSL